MLTQRYIFSVLLFGIVCYSAVAQSSAPSGGQAQAETLIQLTDKLKKNAVDNVLREQIIKLANETKPQPTIPEEARKSFVEGTTVAKAAKDMTGQKLVIESFKEALKVAPWWGDAYYNLALAQELAEQYDEAAASLKFYILTKPGEKDERAAQDKIYAIGAKKKLSEAEAVQKEAARKAAEDTPEAREKRFFDRLEGAVFTSYRLQPADKYAPAWTYRETIIARNRELIMLRAEWQTGLPEPDIFQGKEAGRIQLRANVTIYSYKDSTLAQDHGLITVNVGSDMRSIITTSTWYTHKYTANFSRVR